MKLTHGTQEDLIKALEVVNKRYEGNIMFNRLDGNIFTLKVKDSKGPGHRVHYRYSWNGYEGERRSRSACWHVHGHFFDALFEINPDAVVWSCGNKITAEEGNWIDKNIGSQMFPLMYSESCECE